MDDWNPIDQENTASDSAKGISAGRWDAAMTAVALVSVAAASFLAAWLTKDIQSRPFWMLGICFAAPVVALLVSVFLKEKISSAMTPSSSRKTQLILVGCSILTAFAVGCFCHVANHETEIRGEVAAGEGWSDVLVILDKSGSMNYSLPEYKLMRGEITLDEFNEIELSDEDKMDTVAANAVVELISQMDDGTKVGLLIDVGWEENNDGDMIVPLDQRFIPIAALQPEQREKLSELARCRTLVNENFSCALEAACEAVRQYDGSDGELSIIIISDGLDGTGRFRAADFADRLIRRKVKVHYLYVSPDYSEEMSRLAEMTGGSSNYIQDRTVLREQLKIMTMVPIIRRITIYHDALRTINESVTAKIVTGALLLLLGLLLGLSLTVLFSVQGQRRFQMVLSPLMAILAFAILAFGQTVVPIPWIREGIAFSLFGIVLMRRNRETGGLKRGDGRQAGNASGSGMMTAGGDEW